MGNACAPNLRSAFLFSTLVGMALVAVTAIGGIGPATAAPA